MSSIVDDVLNFKMKKEKKVVSKEVAEAMEKVVKRIPYKFQEDSRSKSCWNILTVRMIVIIQKKSFKPQNL